MATEEPSVLVLAPLAEDGPALARLAEQCGLPVWVCGSPAVLHDRLTRGEEATDMALFVVLAEEGAGEETGRILRDIAKQEPTWSELPILFLAASAGDPPPAYRLLQDGQVGAHAVLLERPVNPRTLASLFRVQAAARRRQFELRALLDSLAAAERRKSFLLDELRHRSRNSLSVLQSLFTLTAMKHDTLDGFVQAFSGRIRTLARTHSALAGEAGELQDLAQLLSDHVQPYCSEAGQLRLSGPAVTLTERTALDLAMVVHELATNAAKYGALSVSDGTVNVAWSVCSDTWALSFTWQEDGGPLVAPPDRRGLGSDLLQTMALGGTAKGRLDYRRQGLVWRVALHAGTYSLTDPLPAAPGPHA